jgi:leucyl-tRNA synthetase
VSDQLDLPACTVVPHNAVQVVEAALQRQRLLVDPWRQARSALIVEDEVVVPGQVLKWIEVFGITPRAAMDDDDRRKLLVAKSSNMKSVVSQLDKFKREVILDGGRHPAAACEQAKKGERDGGRKSGSVRHSTSKPQFTRCVAVRLPLRWRRQLVAIRCQALELARALASHPTN